jgi:predicted Zn-dependent protease
MTKSMKINIKYRKSITSWLLLLACMIGFTTHADNHSDLPDIGDSSGKTISPAEEKMLGENLMRWLRQNQLIIEDPLIQGYIDAIGHRLLPASDHQEQKFTFFVVNDPGINAFAAPGGYIGVNLGLILTTHSESELAAVLAHEIAHITQRHMARAFEAASQHQLTTTVAILAAILIGQQNSDLSQAALSAGIASSAQQKINFTRANEQEADRIGINILANSGYNPFSMATFFDHMGKALRIQGTQIPEFLSTHPVSVSRIADAESRASQMGNPNINESTNYHLIHARIRALFSKDIHGTESQFRQNLKDRQYRHEDAERYGYALALMRNNKFAAAGSQIKPLVKKEPGRIAYRILQAEVEKKLGHMDKALQLYKKALLDSPNNHALSIYYIESLLAARQAVAAREYLHKYLRTETADASIYKLIAQASTKAGYPAEAHQHMAEYYYLIGQTQAAIEQLTLASDIKGLDFYQSSRIEARLQQLKSLAGKEKP